MGQNIAAILVTHDRDEAFRIAQEIATVDRGQLTPPMDRHELFRSPGTCAGARLTGCKNISAARRLDAAHIEATDWGITLTVTDNVTDAHHIAIRAHYFVPVQEGGENVFPAQIVEMIESTFSMIVMLRFADGAHLVRWEVDKPAWEALHVSENASLRICFPPDALMLLRD